MAADWSKCFICQNETEENALSTPAGLETLSVLLPQFSDVNALEFDLQRFCSIEFSLIDNLKQNGAIYHRSCYKKHNQQKLDRAVSKINKLSQQDENAASDAFSPLAKRRSMSQRSDVPKKGKCCFCKAIDDDSNLRAAGTLHATYSKADSEHVKKLTEKWLLMARTLNDDELIRDLSSGDVCSNELFYHKEEIKYCLASYHRSYLQCIKDQKECSLNESEDWTKSTSFNKLKYFILNTEKEEPGTIFAVKDLEQMYIEMLRSYNIEIESHVTRFAVKLCQDIRGLEVRNIGKKLTLFFTDTANSLISENLMAIDEYSRSMHAVALQLRNDLSNTNNTFNGSFAPNCQENSIPQKLVTLISLIIDGCGVENKGHSQQALSISQLVQSNFHKRTKTDSTDHHRRLVKQRETPAALYTSLKIYGTVRSKNLIDYFFNMGICVSYDRVLEVTKELSDTALRRYNEYKVFTPTALRKNVFTIVAKDNIDHNATSSTAMKHYHGTSMTVMQFISDEYPGDKQVFPPSLQFGAESSAKNLKIPSSFINVENMFLKKTPIWAPVCTVNLIEFDRNIYKDEISNELIWLESLNLLSECDSWSKHHSRLERSPKTLPGINSILPLIPEPVHTLDMQHHCMKIIKRTINHLNPDQTPIDASDQPVYALSKEIQYRFPIEFSPQEYFSLFGSLHIEHISLIMHGELIRGSGLFELLSNNEFTIIGTGAVVNASHIKQARYCLQVSLSAIFLKLTDAAMEAGSNLKPLEWLKSQITDSDMCNYWYLIIKLQINILLFIRSLRESNFPLYVISLKKLAKWMFALDHYNYARWITVHLFDLMALNSTCPDVYDRFMKGDFSFQKSNRIFSKMGIDQVHEQNNELIKNNGGATHLLNRADSSSLEKWEIATPELARLISEFENNPSSSANSSNYGKHHEDTPAFQKRFSSDVNKLYHAMVYNPFQLEKLTTINNASVTYDSGVNAALRSLLPTGKRQFKSFLEDRLIMGKVSIDTRIKKNLFKIPGTVDAKIKEEEKKLVYPSSVLTKIREAVHYREEQVKCAFAQELFGVAQCIAETTQSLYHGQKSDILKKFTPSKEAIVPNNSAIIFDLSLLTKSHMVQPEILFSDFAMSMERRINNLSKNYARCDIISDRYFKNSLKEGTRKKRGSGTVKDFNDDTRVPSNLGDFLSCNQNKDNLNKYIAQKITSHSISPQVVVATYNDTILTNRNELLTQSDITFCRAEEADHRSIRHLINCANNHYSTITVCTYDTDVLFLLLSVFPLIKQIHPSAMPSIYCRFGIGDNYRTYNINGLSLQLGEDTCKGLPFFHAFTGCDTVSAFFNHSKVQFWDCWISSTDKPVLDDVFQRYSDMPSDVKESDLDTLEKFILKVYDPKSIPENTLADYRLQLFKSLPNSNLRLLPPSRPGLVQHTKRACLQAGWIWRDGISNTDIQEPENWGWRFINDKFVPKWQVVEKLVNILDVTKTCTCSKSICKNCVCAKQLMKCLPFCRCKRKCKDNIHIGNNS